MNYKVKDTALDATATAIQFLTGGSSHLEWDDTVGFADTIFEIENGYDSLKNFIEQHDTITSFEDPGCSIIGDYVFANCHSLTTASFPVCTSIGSCAFQYCYSLTTVSFPACTSIGSYAFQYCYSLTTVSFPVCTSIGSYAFLSCHRLTTASFQVCTSIGKSAFYNCHSLTTVSFPACTSIGSYAFGYCAGLTTCIFSNTATASSIYASAFYKCYKLLSLYLLGSTLYKLQNANAFASTPISTYTTSTGGINGSIFVPQSLLASYKASTNWVTYSNRFVGLTDAQIAALENEGYDNVIGFHIDGTYCIAEEGMTWAEWCESDYNTVSARIEYGYVWYQSSSMLDNANANDAIKANNFYTSAFAGGMEN